MAAHSSISQSIQASIVLCQHQQQQQQEDGNGRQGLQQQQNQHQHSLSLCKKIMLTAALFGTEATVTFEQVYSFLSLQYMGVPVSLMSLNGIVAGPTTALLIPVLGLLVDRGSNPKKRKMLALLFGLCLMLSGLFLVISACSMKIASMASISNIRDKQSLHPDVNRSFDLTPPSGSVTGQLPKGLFENTPTLPADKSWSRKLFAVQGNVNMSINRSSQSYSKVTTVVNHPSSGITPQFDMDRQDIDSSVSASMTLTGILGTMGYMLIDIGYDFGNPFVRAFVLDHTPPVQHTNLLVTATLMASTAGTMMSLLGVFDLSTALSETFHVDGTAATFIFLLVILIFAVIICYACTLLTGTVIKRNMQKEIIAGDKKENEVVMSSKERHDRRKVMDNDVLQETDSVYSEHQNSLEQSLLKEFLDCIQEQSQGERLYNDKTPLLSCTDTTSQMGYLSFSLSVSSLTSVETDVTAVPSTGPQSNVDASTVPGIKSQISDTIKLHGIAEDPAQTICLDIDKNKVILPHQIHDISVSNAKASLGDFYEKKLEDLISCKTTVKKQKAFLSKRLILLLVSTCFSMSTTISFTFYVSNTLTLGVYHGDPLALPGTTENENYQQGLRVAALGSLIFYICYFITCVFNVKIYDFIGERAHFMICHAALAICSCAFVVTKRVEAYYVAMAVAGPFRTCVYTTTYVLATKYTEDWDQQNMGKDARKSKSGRVMSLIGVMLPATYIVISSVMAPLIDVTGSVWLPIIWSTTSTGLSMITFSFLFFV